MLPHLMRFNMEDNEGITWKYAEVAKAFGVYEEGKSDAENGEKRPWPRQKSSHRLRPPLTLASVMGEL